MSPEVVVQRTPTGTYIVLRAGGGGNRKATMLLLYTGGIYCGLNPLAGSGAKAVQ